MRCRNCSTPCVASAAAFATESMLLPAGKQTSTNIKRQKQKLPSAEEGVVACDGAFATGLKLLHVRRYEADSEDNVLDCALCSSIEALAW